MRSRAAGPCPGRVGVQVVEQRQRLCAFEVSRCGLLHDHRRPGRRPAGRHRRRHRHRRRRSRRQRSRASARRRSGWQHNGWRRHGQQAHGLAALLIERRLQPDRMLVGGQCLAHLGDDRPRRGLPLVGQRLHRLENVPGTGANRFIEFACLGQGLAHRHLGGLDRCAGKRRDDRRAFGTQQARPARPARNVPFAGDGCRRRPETVPTSRSAS
jgi:hypothetical protein